MATSILTASLAVPIVLLLLHRNVDGRTGGGLLIALTEGVLVLIAAVFLVLPVAWLATGAASRQLAIVSFVVGLVGSLIVAIISAPAGAVFSIFLVVPAVTLAALLVGTFATRRPD
ncbi:hypothetical protein WDU99_10335 [Microbacterium sp. Mu-80]|uniref:Uncharacterized protein n=1 Tax=Microbacterium bandirmense TaxID=3122050 RepID=A0ABU8LD60_9MICO